jgi:hypothetical protein
MSDLNTIYLVVFIFSSLTVLRTVAKVISSIISTPPKELVWSREGLIFLGLAITYCLTYIIKY